MEAGMMNIRVALLIGSVAVSLFGNVFAGDLQAVTRFGTNPGNLRMYKYVPENILEKAPLVVVLHGCTQTAESYAKDTGFNELADDQGFLVVYAEQDRKNNPYGCFNWFSVDDADRGEGEAASIAQMVDKMKADYDVDADKVFVTGVSAGGCMTSNMLAAYPDVFAGGAVMAGIPRGCAENAIGGMMCMFRAVDRSPSEWGDEVREASAGVSFTRFPIVSVFHGSEDQKVPSSYVQELVDQWTNAHATDTTPELDAAFRGHAHQVYYDGDGTPVVETYILDGMGHGISVDPGMGEDQGGQEGDYAFNKGIWSSYYAAKFWGIVQPPVTVPPSVLRGCPCASSGGAER
jgi:poly(hydroxyalkanoate) depolymerase family esterase